MKASKLIKFLFILPRNKYHCQYQINNEPNLRGMTYEDMYDYILKLVPTKSKEIYDRLLVYHQHFFIDVVKQEIKDFTFDSDREILMLKHQVRGNMLNEASQELKKTRIQKSLKNEHKLNDKFFKIFSKSKKY